VDKENILCDNVCREREGVQRMGSTIYETRNHVKFLARHLEKTNLRGSAIVFLLELRVPTKCVGFELALQSILLQYKDPTRALSNDIYLEVMLHNRQATEEQVQQAIRDAIRVAWGKGSRTAWNWYFSYDGKAVTERPSASEFISRLAYILELLQSEVHYEKI